MANKLIVSAGAGASLTAIVMAAVLPLIQNFEGTKHTPYKDVGGVLTVCSGHTGVDVTPKTYYTDSQCVAFTEQDAEKASQGVLKTSPHLKYHPMQLAAAISFSYNVGVEGYAKSSVAKDFNTGDFQAGCSALLKYTYAGGVWSQGLANRRQAEYNVCVSTLTPKGLANVATSN